MSRLPLLVAAAMSATSGAYTIIYLYRWEWNRAAIAGLFFVATELIVVTALLLRRLHRIERRVERLLDAPPADDPTVEATLHAHRPDHHDHFGWLRGSASSSNVFLPVLLGLGVVASALAWLVEHLARLTASPALERRLAQRLAPISVPRGGLLAPPAPRSAEARGLRSVGWVGMVVVVLAATAAASAAGLDHLADQIQTRPDAVDADVRTVLELQLHGSVALDDPERTFAHLWSVCTAPSVFSDRHLEPSTVVHGANGSVEVVVPQDVGEHGVDRLTGCLRDTSLDRVQASVLRVRTVGR